MARIVISGIRPYDGEYEFDEERAFNVNEWRWIKKISGYMPLTISEGFDGGDPDLFVALAVIAMKREERISREDVLQVAEALSEAPFDGQSISFISDQVENDAVPPALTSGPDEQSPSGSLEKQTSSGEPSRSGSGRSDETPSPTTALNSDTSWGSPPAKLVT